MQHCNSLFCIDFNICVFDNKIVTYISHNMRLVMNIFVVACVCLFFLYLYFSITLCMFFFGGFYCFGGFVKIYIENAPVGAF